jgi:ADP-ribose pyrophosphatase YjhB (NUDIX family)
MRSIRVSAKAIVIEDGRLLLLRMRDREGAWYLLPGGGQRHGEPLDDTVRRECAEEVGAAVEVGEIALVRDYIGAHHEFADEDPGAHQVEIMFLCRLAPGERPRVGDGPDTGQQGVEWVALKDLKGIRIYPSGLADRLRDGPPAGRAAYMGDAN